MSMGRRISFHLPRVRLFLITSWKVRLIVPIPLAENTMMTSGAWNSSPRSRCQLKSYGLIPENTRVFSYWLTSQPATKLPE